MIYQNIFEINYDTLNLLFVYYIKFNIKLSKIMLNPCISKVQIPLDCEIENFI